MEKTIRFSIRGWIRLVVLAGATIWMWWFFRSYLLLMALILIIGCAAASFGALVYGADRISVRAVLPESRVGRGSSFPFSIEMENRCRFLGFSADLAYTWGNVFTGYFQEKKERFFLSPGKGCEILQSLETQYVGRIEASITSFIVYDPLHLFYAEGFVCTDSGVVAYPMPVLAPDEEIYSCVEGFPKEDESKKRGTEYNPDYEIREYIPGDELRNIHWKLTAKQNRLMVRERLKSGNQKINVLLPLTNDRKENDDLMDALYYLGQLLLEKEYPVQLFWPGTGKDLRAGYIAELGELEAVLGEILSGSGMHLPGSAREQMEMEHPGESYILVQSGAYKGAYIQ